MKPLTGVLWFVERREATEDSDEQFWLTDGLESFHMTSKFIAELLASYLNKYATERHR